MDVASGNISWEEFAKSFFHAFQAVKEEHYRFQMDLSDSEKEITLSWNAVSSGSKKETALGSAVLEKSESPIEDLKGFFDALAQRRRKLMEESRKVDEEMEKLTKEFVQLRDENAPLVFNRQDELQHILAGVRIKTRETCFPSRN